MLGDGDKFFTQVADQEWRQSGAMVSMKITEEFLGLHAQPGGVERKGLNYNHGVASHQLHRCQESPDLTLPRTRLGFASPSLLFSDAHGKLRATGCASLEPARHPQCTGLHDRRQMVEPLISQWLGAGPRPSHHRRPARIRAILPLKPILCSLPESPEHPAGKPYRRPRPCIDPCSFSIALPWLREGVAFFMSTLWVERNSGREAAIAQLDNARGALSLVEPAAAAQGSQNSGESLIAAKDSIYYRTKATYVFWMLRDLAGDNALTEAFRKYDPAGDADGTEFEGVLEQASHKDLKWFFTDWVYHDRGLPDLSIAGVHPNSANAPGSFIVAVDVANNGGAAAEVPVSVRSDQTTVTERFLVPANSSVTRRFLLTGEPVEVAVNDGTVPETVASVHRRTISDQP